MRFSTRAATLAISARVGAGPSRNAGGAVAFRTGEHAIRHQDVKMYEATENRVEALHESHSKRLAAGARSMLLPARYFLHEDAALRRQRVRSEREASQPGLAASGDRGYGRITRARARTVPTSGTSR